jgi:excisionase family DNA binding protein
MLVCSFKTSDIWDMDDLITTTEAADLAGVGVSSIKRWADQKKIRSVRTPGGHRRVHRSDIVRFLLEKGEGDGGPTAAWTNGWKRVGTMPPFMAPVPALDLTPPAEGDSAGAGRYWAEAMLRADVYELQALLLTARSRNGSWHGACDEAAQGLQEIGVRWMRGDITVMEEHVASERLSRALAAIMANMPRSAADPVCLLASVGGDQHTLGLAFLQLCVRESGWQSLWVGGSTPEDEIVSMAGSGRVNMIALSASPASDKPQVLKAIANKIGAACQRSGTLLVLGGSAPWPEKPPFGKRMTSFSAFHHFLGELH